MMSQAFGIWSATESAFSNGSCGYLESEIVTPDGAQPSVLLNDGLDPAVEYAAELVSAPASATFFELGWDGSFEYEGPLPATFSYRVREWGAYVGPASISVTISAASAPESSIVKVSVSGSWFDAEIKHSNGSAWSSVEIRHYSGGWTPL